MHKLVLNTLINLLIIAVASLGAYHFVKDRYLGLPLWISVIMALVAVGAILLTVYREFIHDYEAWKVERSRIRHLGL